MDPKKLKKKAGPESIIQDALIDFLTLKGWYCKSTHGNIYQFGFPDLYACHKRYGSRWIEVKYLEGYRFTPAQLDVFPQFSAHGVGVWILVAATEYEYQKLFLPPNWHTFMM